MIYKMSEHSYNVLRKKIKPRDRESTQDTPTRRSFLAPHPNFTPHSWIIWYVNQMLGLPDGTITEVVYD